MVKIEFNLAIGKGNKITHTSNSNTVVAVGPQMLPYRREKSTSPAWCNATLDKQLRSLKLTYSDLDIDNYGEKIEEGKKA